MKVLLLFSILLFSIICTLNTFLLVVMQGLFERALEQMYQKTASDYEGSAKVYEHLWRQAQLGHTRCDRRWRQAQLRDDIEIPIGEYLGPEP